MKRKKCLVLETVSDFGGAQYDNLLIQRNRNEFDFITVIPKDGVYSDFLTRDGLDYRVENGLWAKNTSRVRKGKKTTDYSALISNVISGIRVSFVLRRMVKDLEIDLIISNSVNAHLIGGITSILSRTPIVFRLMDVIRPGVLFGFGRSVFDKWARIVSADVIVPSIEVQRLMFGSEREGVHVVYNAVDEEDFNSFQNHDNELLPFKTDEDSIVIGIFSRIVQWKGHLTFLQAAEEILPQFAKVKFIVVGGSLFGENSFEIEMKHLAKNYIERGIYFLGFRKDVADLMNVVDIVVVPSLEPDPCPRVVLEAMAMGKCVIGSDQGGIPELIDNGNTGLIFKAGKSRDLTASIVNLVSEPERIREMGRAGFERQKSLFILSEYQRIHFEIFENKIHGS